MEMMKTSLPEMYSKGLYDEFSKALNPDHVPYIYDTFFNGITISLGYLKQKERPSVFQVERMDGSFVLAACIQYVESKDNKNPGSWNISWSFNKEDIPETTTVIKITDVSMLSNFRSYGADKYGIIFKSDENLVTLMRQCAIYLKKWLDENAKEDSEVTIEIDGVFKARVAVENKEKVFAIEVMGETTAKVKEDTTIEK